MTPKVFVKKKACPTEANNPYIVRIRYNSTRWEMVNRDTRSVLGIYPNEETAREARRFQLMREGYEV